MYASATAGSVKSRKWEHVDAFKTFNIKKSAPTQHNMDLDLTINRDNVKMLKSESCAFRRRGKFFDIPNGLFTKCN